MSNAFHQFFIINTKKSNTIKYFTLRNVSIIQKKSYRGFVKSKRYLLGVEKAASPIH